MLAALVGAGTGTGGKAVEPPDGFDADLASELSDDVPGVAQASGSLRIENIVIFFSYLSAVFQDLAANSLGRPPQLSLDTFCRRHAGGGGSIQLRLCRHQRSYFLFSSGCNPAADFIRFIQFVTSREIKAAEPIESNALVPVFAEVLYRNNQ